MTKTAERATPEAAPNTTNQKDETTKTAEREVPEVLKGLILTPMPGANRPRKPMNQLSDSLVATVEAAYEYCKANPNDRLQTPNLGTKAYVDEFLSDMRAYAYHRKDTKGRLQVFGNPVTARDANNKPIKGNYVIRFIVVDHGPGDDEDDDS